MKNFSVLMHEQSAVKVPAEPFFTVSVFFKHRPASKRFELVNDNGLTETTF